MTALNIKSALLNQPIEGELRGQFASALGLAAAQSQLLMRFGYAADLPRPCAGRWKRCWFGQDEKGAAK